MPTFSPSLDPIASWPLVLAAGAVALGLTLWSYLRRLRKGSGRWRWVALMLRVLAVLLCVMASLKPSLLIMRRVKQEVEVLFLLDASASMSITDAVDNKSRYEVAQSTLEAAQRKVEGLGKKQKVGVRALRFSERLRDDLATPGAKPDGPATALGTVLDEALKQSGGARLLQVVLISDGANNAGVPPLLAAQRYRTQQVPIVAVGVGSESAGGSSRDLVARDLIAGPTVFVKNQPAMRGVVAARGFAGKEIEVELYVEDRPTAVDRRKVTVKDASAVIPLTDFKWIPDRAGETRLTLKVVPAEGELVPSNNEVSTYVNVQSGGLAVLYLQGPNFAWEYRFLIRALDSSPEIQATLRVLRRPVASDPRILPEDELAPGKYDVIILGDLPAEFLTPLQRTLIRRNVEAGAGLMMLGGRSSFGAGGWAASELADILPTEIHPGDGQIEPAGGVKLVPDLTGLENYVLRIGAGPAESRALWDVIPALTGANRLGPAKPSAIILARLGSPDGEPVMVAQDVGGGRVLAFGGETWPWYTTGGEAQAAHRKFWRQAILWLAHKEDAGADQVRLALDRRRVAVGQRLDMTATARDAQGEPLGDVTFATSVERVGPAPAPGARPESVELFNQGREARGNYFATGQPGEYRVKVTGSRGGQVIGEDSARFLVYQEDRELENPAADFQLLRQLAELTGGKALAPEQLDEAIGQIDPDQIVESVVQKQVRLWDNWPFLLLFATVLTLEWWLRKRNGWV